MNINVKKTGGVLLILLIIAVFSFWFKVYVYDTAKLHYCSAQLREKFPNSRGSLGDEEFAFYTECYDSLGMMETLRLIASRGE